VSPLSLPPHIKTLPRIWALADTIKVTEYYHPLPSDTPSPELGAPLVDLPLSLFVPLSIPLPSDTPSPELGAEPLGPFWDIAEPALPPTKRSNMINTINFRINSPLCGLKCSKKK
jgi:hypothetical protein